MWPTAASSCAICRRLRYWPVLGFFLASRRASATTSTGTGFRPRASGDCECCADHAQHLRSCCCHVLLHARSHGRALPDRQRGEGFSIEEVSVTATSAPADHLAIRASAPDWFRWAVFRPQQSRRIVVEGCSIHYLLWPTEAETSVGRGLLFVHGGGAHAYWWSFIAPYFTRHLRGPRSTCRVWGTAAAGTTTARRSGPRRCAP
jgi:hypothetical protein